MSLVNGCIDDLLFTTVPNAYPKHVTMTSATCRKINKQRK